MLQIFHNNRCGKSRNCLALLESTGKEFEIVSYLTTPPTAEALKIILQKLNLSPIELIRQKEKIWIEKYKGQNFTNEELITIMVNHPILIERPILITDEKAIIAREENKVIDFLK
ncbi:arsenate reductase (glutaredoxin) [Flavobacterium succinicans]|uniref:Arsenate reductase n=1 Tax=Flavobacterium succinicans TaxID=29536 RepID=A0A199XRD0_9FLAO|nr:arsenate reductase (glutaredoxin) [Flavobacterium succinicans]OAZ04190.1 arsenate reductase [Flavobacterium succinicans]